MTFQHPEWLAAIVLLPALLVGAVLATRFRRRAWRSLVAERLQPTLLHLASPLPRWLALAALLVALTCLIIALARPQGDAGSRTEAVSGRNLLLALDLSQSMLVTDVRPNRLDQSKTIALDLLDSLPDDRIGVIGFAGAPFLVAPLTVDHAAVRETIQQLDTTTIPAGGSDLASAVDLATRTCIDGGYRHSALVIISDGEEHDGGLAEAANAAERAGIMIFTIGVGTEDGDTIPDPRQPDGQFRDVNGSQVVSSLRPESLRTLATKTGGRYIQSASGAAIGPMIDAAIADLARFEVSSRTRSIAIEFFQWLILPAVLLLMTSIIAGTNWRWVPRPATTTAALALACCLPTPRLHAAPPIPGLSALAATPSTEKHSRYRLAEGTAALATRDHDAARSSLSNALLSNDPAVQAAAHHNLGNNLLATGWETLSDGEPFTNSTDAPAELRRHVLRKLAGWMRENPEDGSISNGFRLFESVLLDWTDAIDHYQSALLANPSQQGSAHNRQLAKRLLELLRDTLEQTVQEQQQQMTPSPESGQPDKGGQQGDPPPDPKDPQNPGDQPSDRPQDQPGPDGQPKPDQDPGPDGNPGDKPQDGSNQSDQAPDDKAPLEDETPEEQARRLLRDHADFEQGPLIRHQRRDFERPLKDW